MTGIHLTLAVLDQIHLHGAQSYPDEGAGFLLGRDDGQTRVVTDLIFVDNAREKDARFNRYLMSPRDVLSAEMDAERRGLDIVGVFHSHPDHPNHPSEFDRQWALPWLSYLITSVEGGQATASRSWRLTDDRLSFTEEKILLTTGENIK